MNYLVLAAGMGTRLHPYTRNYPKSMLKLGNNKCALQNTIDSITNNAPVMMFISTSLLAPFVEEGIFRLGLRSVIKEKYLFIAISGLVFGFMHIFPTELPLYVALIQSIVYVAMGICLAYMYTETDNIWITIIIHALNNFLSMAAILIF